jgi:hypothetical protein
VPGAGSWLVLWRLPGACSRSGLARSCQLANASTQLDANHFTSICNEPLVPPVTDVWAVIVTVPGRFPVTTPLGETVAVVVLELDQ